MGDMEREMNELEPLKGSIRERLKGLKTKRRIPLVCQWGGYRVATMEMAA